jgi:hypothetical protein
MDHNAKLTVGQLLFRLRQMYRPDNKALMLALKTSHATYRKIERDLRDLSFIMALKLCQFYDIDIHDFISMLADHELDRPDISSLKDVMRKEKKRKAILESQVQQL